MKKEEKENKFNNKETQQVHGLRDADVCHQWFIY